MSRPSRLRLSLSVPCLAQNVENVHRADRADDGGLGGFIIRRRDLDNIAADGVSHSSTLFTQLRRLGSAAADHFQRRIAVKVECRFPPPWTAEESDACFVVRDANGHALAYVYFEEEPGRRSAVHFLILVALPQAQ